VRALFGPRLLILLTLFAPARWWDTARAEWPWRRHYIRIMFGVESDWPIFALSRGR